ncbi:hypothetical protein PPL_10618 [Heterostelium album PN500]|uniref:CCD97-like C-terminal domain-containing protein n=1 Tax=Heterostelium pallidum (strain ATCC 26659 / Pp 5 / PN500) TaxID=670386 RepID=D3BRK7_HETP5|nr:hypothetical protein PPL_10618 [Heterostelium album PN500]EFA76039.1 hypothetical protein PPL_10618 [Heterostelium album PN500]|eukprot:XP_020428173.1 hypothetical protein PPL_10618 [Heterostelium album PN500]
MKDINIEKILDNIINSIYFIVLKSDDNNSINNINNSSSSVTSTANVKKEEILQLYKSSLSNFLDKYGYHLNKLQLSQLKEIEILGENHNSSTSRNSNKNSRVNDLLEYMNQYEKKEKLKEVTLINGRYLHMKQHLLEKTDYFSIEKCRKRHPYLYYCYVGRYQTSVDQPMLYHDQPYDKSAKISERLMINAQVEHDQFQSIDNEIEEIDYLTSKINQSLKLQQEQQQQQQRQRQQEQQSISSPESLWFKHDNKSTLEHLKDMLTRKNELMKQKNMINTLLHKKKRERERDMEEEEEEEEEEVDVKMEVEEVEEEEEEDMNDEEIQEIFDSFIDKVKDMFIHGHDQKFDYHKIDSSIIDDIDSDNEDYFNDIDSNKQSITSNNNNNISNINSKVYNLGEEDDYDYEEEYRQSLLLEK